eukprot:10373918-Alexandrium_andersonii.AAC.1
MEQCGIPATQPRVHEEADGTLPPGMTGVSPLGGASAPPSGGASGVPVGAADGVPSQPWAAG